MFNDIGYICWGTCYRVYGLRLGPNFGVRPVADKNFYLRLTVEKMHALVVFTEKSLPPYDCSGTNFTTVVNCTVQKLKCKLKL